MLTALTDQLIDHFEKPEIQQKIQSKILEPVVVYMRNRLWPLFLTMMIAFILLFVMVAYLLHLSLRGKKMSI